MQGRMRRCAVLWIEPRDVVQVRLEDLMRGGTGVVGRIRWYAHAPHLPQPVELDELELRLLGRVGPNAWSEPAELLVDGDPAPAARLLEGGLLVPEDGPGDARSADLRFREVGWHGLAAAAHAGARWRASDAASGDADEGPADALALRRLHGPPPPLSCERGDGVAPLPLPRGDAVGFDALLDARCTCRNFDSARGLPLADFARMLERVFSARAVIAAAPGFEVMKRSSPSGGALHPTEAYLLVQRVDGVAPGLYHYRPREHALQPLRQAGGEASLRALAGTMVAGQDYFADAHVLVALAPRFARNFWKYRNHAKAYRVCILDVGHLSQTLLLSAAEQGLGAFITAAINEVDIEQAFGLTGYVDGPLAVCGFGIRADTMASPELDPRGMVWPLA